MHDLPNNLFRLQQTYKSLIAHTDYPSPGTVYFSQVSICYSEIIPKALSSSFYIGSSWIQHKAKMDSVFHPWFHSHDERGFNCIVSGPVSFKSPALVIHRPSECFSLQRSQAITICLNGGKNQTILSVMIKLVLQLVGSILHM